MKKSTRNNLIAIAALAIIVIAVYFYMTYTPEEEHEHEVIMLDNETPEIDVEYFIVEADCPDCYDIDEIVDFIRSLPGVTMKEVSADDDAVSKYSIRKLPALVIKGDVEKLQIPEFTLRQGALVLTDTPAPYFDVEKDRVVGKVKMTIIENPDCVECFSPKTVIKNLETIGVELAERDALNYTDERAEALIEKYGIARLPVMIFSDDLLAYAPVRNIWNTSGTIEEDGMLVTREVNPPYYAIETGEVRGIVGITVLTDDSCEECYDPNVHRLMLERQFMMKFGDEAAVDVSSEEGKALVERYSIVNVPTVVLSDEAAVYPLIPTVWSNAGTIEDDGVFIVRNIDTVPGVKYKNLETGEIKEGRK